MRDVDTSSNGEPAFTRTREPLRVELATESDVVMPWAWWRVAKICSGALVLAEGRGPTTEEAIAAAWIVARAKGIEPEVSE